jgi:hypothetical protein
VSDAADLARGEPTGFPNRTDATVSKVDGTRTFTIQPASSSFTVWVGGEQYSKQAAESIVWADTEGLHYFYYVSGAVLTTSTARPDIANTAWISILYWKATATKAALYFTGANEMHGIVMSGETHRYLHDTRGASYESGLGLTNMTTDGGGATNAGAQLGVADGIFHDEDVEIEIEDNGQELSPTAELPVWYLTGARLWRKKTADTYPFVYAGQEGSTGTLVSYNSVAGSTWGWTECGNAKYLLIHIFATNDIDEPMISIQGQAEYASRTAARVGADTELLSLYTDGLPTAEFVAIATVIIQTAAYANTPNAQFVTVDGSGADYVDWRGTQLSPSSSGSLEIHNLGGSLHAADTLANLNTKISDGIVVDKATSNAWTACQYQAPVAWTVSSGDIDYDVSTSNMYKYDMASGAAEVQLPTGIAEGMRWSAIITSNATAELTWVANYDWGETGVPDISAIANDKRVHLDFVAVSATAIDCTASVVYG